MARQAHHPIFGMPLESRYAELLPEPQSLAQGPDPAGFGVQVPPEAGKPPTGSVESTGHAATPVVW